MRELLIALAFIMAPLGLWFVAGDGASDLRELSDDTGVPALSEEAKAGRLAFAEDCAVCHGTLAEGTTKGPPLIHPDYAPGVRSDEDFRVAITKGVTAWRWWYGDMPAIHGLPPHRVRKMTRFVRELQRANGIE